MTSERKIGLKNNTKITSMRAWIKGLTTERNSGINNFGSLLIGANKEVLSLVRVYRQTI